MHADYLAIFLGGVHQIGFGRYAERKRFAANNQRDAQKGVRLGRPTKSVSTSIKIAKTEIEAARNRTGDFALHNKRCWPQEKVYQREIKRIAEVF